MCFKCNKINHHYYTLTSLTIFHMNKNNHMIITWSSDISSPDSAKANGTSDRSGQNPIPKFFLTTDRSDICSDITWYIRIHNHAHSQTLQTHHPILTAWCEVVCTTGNERLIYCHTTSIATTNKASNSLMTSGEYYTAVVVIAMLSLW